MVIQLNFDICNQPFVPKIQVITRHEKEKNATKTILIDDRIN
jgi:hypothetical protein